MEVRKLFSQSIVTTLIAMYLAGGSAAIAQETARPLGCNPLLAAAVGGIFGVLVGGKNRRAGAAIGAGLGSLACLAVNYESRQTESGASAREAYSRRTGEVPTTITVENYNATNTIPVIDRQSGQKEVIKTSGTVIIPQGVDSKSEEEILIFPPGEKDALTPTRKPVSISADGGGFENAFTLPLDKESPQGVYTYKVRLITNGNVVGEQLGSFQAV